jgi:hypothetical protein
MSKKPVRGEQPSHLGIFLVILGVAGLVLAQGEFWWTMAAVALLMLGGLVLIYHGFTQRRVNALLERKLAERDAGPPEDQEPSLA